MPGPNYIGGLRIIVNDDKPLDDTKWCYKQTQLRKGDPKFLCVAAAANHGLRLLESERGTKYLIEIGVSIIKWAKEANKPHSFNEDEVNESSMTRYAKPFLAEMRKSFIPLVLSNHMRGEGRVEKYNWDFNATSSEDYDLGTAGIMKLNKLVCGSCLPTGNSANSLTQRVA